MNVKSIKIIKPIRKNITNKIIFSVDLDMWWHCRWATGSPNAIWKDIKNLFLDYYGSEKPDNSFVIYCEKTLALLEQFNIKATFFILGEVAVHYPNLIKKIANNGHEIACHGWHHVDMTMLNRKQFRYEVEKAKKLLEDLTGQKVIGYRAPNLVITPWFIEEIINLDFIYDSSICPSRKFFGKYKGMSKMPNNPFIIICKNTHKSESKFLIEIPVTAMPYVRLPACSGIITRILGKTWTKIALFWALQHGHVMYYFHPYEIGYPPFLKDKGWYIKLFFRNVGKPFIEMLKDIFQKTKVIENVVAKDIALNMLELYELKNI